MKNIQKTEVESDSSSFDPLPDEIVLQICNKLNDLETLYPCKLVSKRFYRIILQVDTISYKTEPATSFTSFQSAIPNLRKFGKLKSLSICIPSPPSDPYLLKWKINCGNKLDSFLFLSPNSIHHKKENDHEQEEGEEDMELKMDKYLKAKSCLDDAVMSHVMLLSCIANIPSLEKVSLMDSRQRCWISLSGEKVAEMRKGLSVTSSYETFRRNRVRKCYVPLLELPVSGYLLKDVTLYLMERVDLPDYGYDTTFMNIDDDFEDKEEAAFSEAVMEIFKNHRARVVRMDDFTSYTFL